MDDTPPPPVSPPLFFVFETFDYKCVCVGGCVGVWVCVCGWVVFFYV